MGGTGRPRFCFCFFGKERSSGIVRTSGVRVSVARRPAPCRVCEPRLPVLPSPGPAALAGPQRRGRSGLLLSVPPLLRRPGRWLGRRWPGRPASPAVASWAVVLTTVWQREAAAASSGGRLCPRAPSRFSRVPWEAAPLPGPGPGPGGTSWGPRGGVVTASTGRGDSARLEPAAGTASRIHPSSPPGRGGLRSVRGRGAGRDAEVAPALSAHAEPGRARASVRTAGQGGTSRRDVWGRSATCGLLAHGREAGAGV